MAFHEYPYTDFHEMNLDWILQTVKQLTEDWAQVRSDWEDEQAAFADLQSYIENYFNNLNVQQEINVKLDGLVLDGTMSELIAPYVASGLPAVVAAQIGDVVAAQIGPVVAAQIGAVVADQLPAIAASAAATEVGTWLSTHVDPDTGYVIDDSLTVQGAAADAKAVGDEVTEIKSALSDVAEKINLEFSTKFDNQPIFYIDNTYLYIYWTGQFHIFGVSGRNKDISLADAKTQVGAGNVATSPEGRESIVINGSNWLVWDIDNNGMAVIARGNFNFNKHLLLMAHSARKPTSGCMYGAYLEWYADKAVATQASTTATQLATKSNKVNNSVVGVFDLAHHFETDGTYVYVRWSGQWHFRGVAYRNQDVSFTDAKTQVGATYVKNAPSGNESIAIPNNYWLVFTINSAQPNQSEMEVISKDNFDFNTHILLLAVAYYKPVGGLMYGALIENNIDAVKTSVENDILNKLKNARHIKGESATPLTLLHFSDLHKDTGALFRIMNDATKFGVSINDYICTGDMVTNTAEEIDDWWDARVMTCIGNHDSASYDAGTGYDWTALSMADRDAYYIAPFESGWSITHTSGTSYYYKDYATQKIRLIVMDAMLYNDNGAEATAQTTWLSNLLSDAITNNLHVLIAIHAPHGGATNIECSFSRYNQGTMPTYTDCNTPQTVIDAVATAITGGLKFIGYLVGHTHQDNMWDAEGDGKQLMYGITCANVATKAQWTNSDQDRSVTEDAYNLVTIDTANYLVKIVRCGGADIDDHMRTRKAVCFDYSTGTKVGEIL